MRFKIFCAPGDHRDDFEVLEGQLNEWAEKDQPNLLSCNSSVTPMTDPRNAGRYLMSVLVAYQSGGKA
ncbi:MAG: hypothetical protein GY778_15625 [bacterium]|nr:hypothetical protein [bacterium]